MSYILEALRKADAERERGAVPDLHAQLLPGASADDEPEERRRPAWVWPALIVALLAVGALSWLGLGDSASPSAAVQPQPKPAQAAPADLPAPTVSVAPTLPAAATATVAPVLSQPRSAAQSAAVAVKPTAAPKAETMRVDAATAPAPRAEKPPPALPRPVESAMAPPSPAPPTTPTANPVAKAAAPAAPVRVPPLNELSDELRRQVPQLAIGGSVYSPQAERRMVVVNGQVFQEGSTLAPELQLEQIRPKSAVFSIRGQRFELPL